ncbi:MAG: SufE family protein [Bacteroidales bacterium]|jgi:cysteine desulfuration protein SufE|nr:SufE family protein [Bacteroidales bacterium]MDD2569633.1 SufE family protein [Bacteroidales bacterium]MDD2812573.1 SufE family protein [Bacteroidales bacterium]MDD3384614.1 SufE family protein [Bacteroidales bacterium]MDD3812363.1 SufE family protein [Bacteroidales bacterium]
MTISEITQKIVEDFSALEEWMDKYNYLIEMGKELPLIDPALRNDNYLIRGCQSRVWINADLKDGKIFYTADSDAIITKGLAALMIRVFTGHTPEEIINADLSFIEKIGLKEHLSPTRSNGLASMIKQIKYFAMAWNLKNK